MQEGGGGGELAVNFSDHRPTLSRLNAVPYWWPASYICPVLTLQNLAHLAGQQIITDLGYFWREGGGRNSV